MVAGRPRRSGGGGPPVIMEIGNPNNRNRDAVPPAAEGVQNEVAGQQRANEGPAQPRANQAAGQARANVAAVGLQAVDAGAGQLIPPEALDMQAARLANAFFQRMLAAIPAVAQVPPAAVAPAQAPPAQAPAAQAVPPEVPQAQRAILPAVAALNQQEPRNPPAEPDNVQHLNQELTRIRRLLRNSQESNRNLQRQLDDERYHSEQMERRLQDLENRHPRPYNNRNNRRNYNNRNRY